MILEVWQLEAALRSTVRQTGAALRSTVRQTGAAFHRASDWHPYHEADIGYLGYLQSADSALTDVASWRSDGWLTVVGAKLSSCNSD